MQYGDTFLVKDLDVANNEEITVLTDLEEIVCSLQEPREEEISDEEVDAADVEVIGEDKESQDAE